MHGLIFETSVRLLAGSTRLLCKQWAKRNRHQRGTTLLTQYTHIRALACCHTIFHFPTPHLPTSDITVSQVTSNSRWVCLLLWPRYEQHVKYRYRSYTSPQKIKTESFSIYTRYTLYTTNARCKLALSCTLPIHTSIRWNSQAVRSRALESK